ncbi:MAG: tryptophan--tRNA ligase [Candidatus Marinimicrobia bacterium]|nr:tryptophan--tRNA ligase [Candidatus Neomarinimicrobiota bacterium]
MKKRILSRMRPTGKLHIGHLVGALENWVSLQETYENFHLVADWHVLTTSLEKTDKIHDLSLEMVTDWLAAGIDPEKSPVFIQSQIKEHAELFLLFSMLVTVPRLERNPAVKEQAKSLNIEDNISYGHLGYPVLQAADILLYRANLVPVGEDQLPHIELCREIARKFNKTYDKVFRLPEAKLTNFPRLPGPDGKRMSKSLGNVILMSDTPDEVFKVVRTAITDPAKIRRNDPGNPEICNVFTWHKKFNPGGIPEIDRDCRSGALGCVDCKKKCAKQISAYLAPIQEKRMQYVNDPDLVKDIIAEGNRRARIEAAKTMEAVHKAMSF